MELTVFKNKLSNLNSENRLLKFALAIISMSSIITAYYSFQAVRYQKVILIPVGMDERVTVQGDTVDATYLKMFAKYSMSLLFNYTPANYADQSADFLALCAPKFYPAMESKILKIDDRVKRLKITSSYYPKTLTADQAAKEMTIVGMRYQSAQGRDMEDVQETYLLKYDIINGRFFITDLNIIAETK